MPGLSKEDLLRGLKAIESLMVTYKNQLMKMDSPHPGDVSEALDSIARATRLTSEAQNNPPEVGELQFISKDEHYAAVWAKSVLLETKVEQLEAELAKANASTRGSNQQYLDLLEAGEQDREKLRHFEGALDQATNKLEALRDLATKAGWIDHSGKDPLEYLSDKLALKELMVSKVDHDFEVTNLTRQIDTLNLQIFHNNACIHPLAEFANKNGWNGVSNSKQLHVFLIELIEGLMEPKLPPYTVKRLNFGQIVSGRNMSDHVEIALTHRDFNDPNFNEWLSKSVLCRFQPFVLPKVTLLFVNEVKEARVAKPTRSLDMDQIEKKIHQIFDERMKRSNPSSGSTNAQKASAWPYGD